MSKPTKKCIGKCKQNKELADFSKCGSRKDGLQKWCKSCAKEYKNNYRTLYKEEISTQNADYYKRNREKTIARQKAQRAKNRTKRSAYEALYHIKNRENINARISDWKHKNPAKLRAYKAKRRAAEIKAAPPWLTKEHWEQMEAIYVECIKITKETGILHHVDHIIPLSGKNVSGLHVPWNLQILTATENLSKSNRLVLTYT